MLKLYWRQHDALIAEDPELGQRSDTHGAMGHTSDQKILSSLRRLGNGLSFLPLDNISRMSSES